MTMASYTQIRHSEVRQRNLAAMIIGKSFRYLDAGITNFITAQVAFPGYQKSVRLCSRHPYKYSENKQISVADTLSKAMQYFKDKDDRMHVRIWMHNMQYLQHDEEIEQYRLRAAYAARVAGFALGMQNANIRQFLLDNNQQVYVDALYESARTTFTENDAQYRRLQPSKE